MKKDVHDYDFCKIVIYDLIEYIKEEDLEREFSKFGRILSITKPFNTSNIII
jgi:hypothetical protein